MILSLVSGFLAWHIKEAVEHHRFHSGVKRFMIQLKEMQSLALSHQNEMRLRIFKDQGSYICKGTSDEPIKLFQPFEMNEISSLTWNGKEVNHLVIDIFSSGRIEPSGVIGLRRGKEGLWIDLRNSPLIKKNNSNPIGGMR
jgi:hypothetical protein